ncbi:ATP-binding protein [Spirillospora sp. CA-294931]|uniref:ATP-binding protein n=1 Tax=Spirillospora sp. CA-294931 TaxID=3240042 RepID=UPI003D90C8BA
MATGLDDVVPLTALRTLRFPAAEPSVRAARRRARELLGPAFPGLFEITVVVSELVTNALRHSRSGEGGQVTVRFLAGEGLLRLEVADDGSGGFPRLREPDERGENGRGLHVVEALALRWGVTRRAGTTAVWADFVAPGNGLISTCTCDGYTG